MNAASGATSARQEMHDRRPDRLHRLTVRAPPPSSGAMRRSIQTISPAKRETKRRGRRGRAAATSRQHNTSRREHAATGPDCAPTHGNDFRAGCRREKVAPRAAGFASRACVFRAVLWTALFISPRLLCGATGRASRVRSSTRSVSATTGSSSRSSARCSSISTPCSPSPVSAIAMCSGIK